MAIISLNSLVMHNLKPFVTAIVLSLPITFSHPAAAMESAKQLCEMADRSTEGVPAKQLLTWREFTEADKVKMRRTRACLKGYSYGFPGGEEAYLKADSQALRRDLSNLTALFETKKLPVSGYSMNEIAGLKKRLEKIGEGWQREQVLLWGNMFLVRAEFNEERYDDVLADAARIRKEFGLDVKPIDHWDIGEDNTYFSPQTLRNIIAGFEWSAKANTGSNDIDAATDLARDYVKQREALRPVFQMTGNLDRDLLVPLCGSN